MIVATVEPVDEKGDARSRPAGRAWIPQPASYTIDVRPFFHPTARMGQVKVHVTSTTTYEIDGQSLYRLRRTLVRWLSTAPEHLPRHLGTLDLSSRTRLRQSAYMQAPASPGQNVDVLWGNVTARSGNTLTVRGGTLIRRSGSVTFIRGDVTVLVGANTGVTRDGQGRMGSGSTLDSQAISVGQRINAFGQVSGVWRYDNSGRDARPRAPPAHAPSGAPLNPALPAC